MTLSIHGSRAPKISPFLGTGSSAQGAVTVPLLLGHLQAGERMPGWSRAVSQYRYSFNFLHPVLERMWSLPVRAAGASHLLWLSPLAAEPRLQCTLGSDSLGTAAGVNPSESCSSPTQGTRFPCWGPREASSAWDFGTAYLLALGGIVPLTVRRWPGLRPRLVHTGPWGTGRQRC